MQQKEKIIVFCSREICYQSSSFFANQMADAFENLGYDVKVCEFSKEDNLDAVFEPLFGQKYRLLLDFNSMLTQMTEDDGTAVPDLLDGPFFDYVLDHPLFHYNCLNANVKNLNAIFLDEAQEAYVNRYYPRVQKTLTMPLGATEALTDEKEEKINHVLVMGTYDSPDKVYEMVTLSPEPLKSYMKELIEMRTEDPLLPMEEGFRRLLKDRGETILDEQFALFMNAMYPVDAYIRDYFRKAAVDTLVKAGIPVTLVGEGWEKYKSPREAIVTREKPLVFCLSFERIAHANILLNVSPFFNHGAHDRIFAGMANRCTVLTDENPYLRERMKDREHVFMYSLKDMHSLAAGAEELMTNTALCREIQEKAYTEFLKKYTWEEKAKELLACSFKTNPLE